MCRLWRAGVRSSVHRPLDDTCPYPRSSAEEAAWLNGHAEGKAYADGLAVRPEVREVAGIAELTASWGQSMRASEKELASLYPELSLQDIAWLEGRDDR